MAEERYGRWSERGSERWRHGAGGGAAGEGYGRYGRGGELPDPFLEEERQRPHARDAYTDDGRPPRGGGEDFGRFGGPSGPGGGVERGGMGGRGYGWDYGPGIDRPRYGQEWKTDRLREAQGRFGGEHRGRGPKGYRRSDDRILEDVSDRLSDESWLDASDIEVQVSGGEVTLSGTVSDRRDKRLAEDVADDVSGVLHVQNNLRVQRKDTSARPAG